jgi:hypothetical protein
LGSTALLTGMTSISLHMQWPLTSQTHGSVSQREHLVFCYRLNSMPICIKYLYIILCYYINLYWHYIYWLLNLPICGM